MCRTHVCADDAVYEAIGWQCSCELAVGFLWTMHGFDAVVSSVRCMAELLRTGWVCAV
jgi:hypothetical protein